MVCLEIASGGTYSVRGPICADARHELERIVEFRHSQYCGRRDYLYAEEQQRIERRLRIDQRSHHFIAESGDRIVGSLRLTPGPFEFEALSPSLAAYGTGLAAHAELSRLVVESTASRHNVTASLVVTACEWARAHGYSGIAALCGRGSRAIFVQYGLSPVSGSGHRIPWRGGETYTLMAGGWPEMIASTTRLSDRLSPRKGATEN
jgi:N-acyl-L-homoserine lactone synthetase